MSNIRNFIKVILACFAIIYVYSCQDELNGNLELEKNKKSIMEYLEKNPSYSLLVEALEKTELSQNLKLYGTMTLFAPANEAFQKYLDRKGVSGIDNLDTEELTEVLKYHLYNRTYDSGFFISGSLGSTTVNGNLIKMDISEGVRKTVLNGNIHIDSLDIPASNGVVHVIDDVLEPPTKTLYGWLKEQPDYSIMLEAFEKTGNDTAILKKVVYDPLNYAFGKQAKKWKTLFLETNDILSQNGINSFDDLVTRYSNTGNYTLATDSLNIFVKYHCIEKRLFISDFRNDYVESFKTGAYIIFDVKSGISINKKETENGFESVGVEFGQSNMVTNNGIIHSLEGLLEPYDPPAVELNLLFAGEPNDRNIQLVTGNVINITDANSFDLLNNDVENQDKIWWLNWGGDMIGTFTADWPANAFKDYCCVVWKNDGEYWLEMMTKPIFKGTYEVYVTYRRTNNTNYFVQFYLDDAELGDLTDLVSGTDAFGNKIPGTDKQINRQIGLVTFEEMGPHKFKLVLPNPGTNYTAWYSLIFKPV